MKKILVTGINGQLGYDVVKRLALKNSKNQVYNVKGVDIADFDLTDKKAVSSFVEAFAPDIIIHCSAYTAVDKAESESDMCFAVNEFGTKYIAESAKKLSASMVYISTDYVYNGLGDAAYEVEAPTIPLGVYGKSKLAGELAAKSLVDKLFVIRTSWVFGINGNNFVKTMLRLASDRDTLGVVSDQIGSPTYTPDLADFIAYIITTDRYGTYHFSNEGFCSWYDFAKEIFNKANIKITLNKILTVDYKTVAPRPLNSRLSKKKCYDIGYKQIPRWQDALCSYLKELKR